MGKAEDAWERIDAAGHRKMFDAALMLIECVEGIGDGKYRKKTLEELVVPGSASRWKRGSKEILEMVKERAYSASPIILGPDLVGIKLVPDPGDVVVTVGPAKNLKDVIFLTLVRCSDVFTHDGFDPLDLDGWRAHSIGSRLLDPSEVIPPDDPHRVRAARKLAKRHYKWRSRQR